MLITFLRPFCQGGIGPPQCLTVPRVAALIYYTGLSELTVQHTNRQFIYQWGSMDSYFGANSLVHIQKCWPLLSNIGSSRHDHHHRNEIKRRVSCLRFLSYLDPPTGEGINLSLGKIGRRHRPSVIAIYPDAFLRNHSMRKHQRDPS
jgi:hypothetical protein